MSKRGQIPHIHEQARETVYLHPWKSAGELIACMPGGAYRDRTDDLKLAKLALSQLS